jgi:CspA family cold shock protein
MKIGTVRWFNLKKGRGCISPDDGGPNVFVATSALESAGLSDLREGQKLVFDIKDDGPFGRRYAVSLSPLGVIMETQTADGLLAANPFDALSAAIASAWRTRLRH